MIVGFRAIGFKLLICFLASVIIKVASSNATLEVRGLALICINRSLEILRNNKLSVGMHMREVLL